MLGTTTSRNQFSGDMGRDVSRLETPMLAWALRTERCDALLHESVRAGSDGTTSSERESSSASSTETRKHVNPKVAR